MTSPLKLVPLCGFKEEIMDRIYLDHASSMPVDPRVIDFIEPYLIEVGNPLSLYDFGQDAKTAIEESRKKIVDLINAESEKTIIFTGGATEANNIAIRGASFRNIKDGKEVLSSAIDHISVINPIDPKSFSSDLKKFCQLHLQSFKVPVNIYFTNTDHHTSRYKKIRRFQ